MLRAVYANKIWDILVADCKAEESDRDSFVYYMTSDQSISEYRFCGVLGFGGKIYENSGGWYISCYREDETESRNKLIDKVNEKLKGLREEYSRDYEKRISDHDDSALCSR